LDGMSDHLEWKECVAAWLEMEHRLGYPAGLVSILNILFFLLQLISTQKREHKLDNNGRPEEITVWQKSGRKYTVMPDLSDKLPSFAASWWRWWKTLQPSWRMKEPLRLSRKVPQNPDWSVLDKGTANGFFVIVLALGWWALGIKHLGVVDEISIKNLLEAIEDTTWVLRQMELPRSTSTKRPRSEDDNTNVKPKRWVFIFPQPLRSLHICLQHQGLIRSWKLKCFQFSLTSNNRFQ
jgi:hypothetical protein